MNCDQKAYPSVEVTPAPVRVPAKRPLLQCQIGCGQDRELLPCPRMLYSGEGGRHQNIRYCLSSLEAPLQI